MNWDPVTEKSERRLCAIWASEFVCVCGKKYSWAQRLALLWGSVFPREPTKDELHKMWGWSNEQSVIGD